jgi:hypothetical protein
MATKTPPKLPPKKKGGPQPGSGRKPGTKNRRTVYQEQRDKVIAAAKRKARGESRVNENGMEVDEHGRELGPDYGDSPMDFLLGIMRDKKQPTAFRAQAAKDIAPYIHPKLATVTVKGTPDAPITTKELSDADFDKIARKVVKDV